MQPCHLSKKLRKREREGPINKTVNDLQWRWNSETYGENEDGETMVIAIMRERKDVKKK